MAQLEEAASKKAKVDETRKKKKNKELELNKGKKEAKKQSQEDAIQAWIALKESKKAFDL